MPGYRGPQPARISAQFATIGTYHAETATLRAWVSGETANASAYLAGAGRAEHYANRTISGLFATVGGNKPAFRDHLTPGGQVQAGDMYVSTFEPLSNQDTVIWRGVIYRVDGDSVPIHMGGRTWWRALLCRGDNA